MAQASVLLADGNNNADPHLGLKDLLPTGSDANVIQPHERKIFDSKVTFEEYYYYANLARQEEDNKPRGKPKGILATIFPTKSSSSTKSSHHERETSNRNTKFENDQLSTSSSSSSSSTSITSTEWTNASRALRTASGMAIFYLITTDILGPFGLPYAFATTGWGPGVGLFTAFGLMAGFSGWLLWQCFMGLDSYHYPLKSYPEVGFRMYGHWARIPILVLQSLQLICNVGVIIISNGEALSQVSKFRLCYAICCFIWAICGFLLGQIRTLQKFGWLANAAVFINLLLMFITMGVAAHTPPLYSAYVASAGYSISPDLVKPTNSNSSSQGNFPPIKHSAGLPDPSNFGGSINGLMQAVYAYAGAQLFLEFMAEMRRPRDFIKAMWGAQLFIYFFYMLYGLFIYAYQGQYIQNPSYLGISNYAWSTTGNVLAMVTALIAATLYGNIGLKVIYTGLLHPTAPRVFPDLNTPKGKWLWASLIPIYWAIAFVVAGAIPDFSGFVALISAVCTMQFTYSFPPFLHLAYQIRKNCLSSSPGEGFDPSTGVTRYADTGLRRFWRGFWGERWYLNCFNVVYCLGALATAGLGIWAAVENMILIYAVPQLNAFTCTSPLNADA